MLEGNGSKLYEGSILNEDKHAETKLHEENFAPRVIFAQLKIFN